MSTTKERDNIKKLYQESGKIDRGNIEYFNENHEWLQEEYAGQIVAIVDGEFGDAIEYEDTEQFETFLNELVDEYSPDLVKTAYITKVHDPNQEMLL